MFFDPLYLLIFIGFTVLGLIVQFRLRSVIEGAKKIPMTNGMTGRQVAEKMLRDHGIYDVKVMSVKGFLSDHYNPADKTINLSPDVFGGNSAAAAAVAAHETGHAVQHATGYGPLKMRSAIVPVVQVSSTIMNFLFIAMAFLAFGASFYNQAILIFVICQAALTVFALITLPVEADATRRGLAWLNNTGLTYGEQHRHAESALRWAGRTYIVAALAAIAQLAYFLLMFANRRD
ncbi:MAG: peptidase membrane zinc metallopeptidase [Bacteroidetes bacterium]|nr:MAG: peptidase membrane zinc metallopeptidase [Bacteroidota bacterium]